MRTLFKRTDDELIKDIKEFLVELFNRFLYNTTVSFTQMKIQQTAKKYHIQGRIHRIIISNEFNVEKRKYSRKFSVFPSGDDIFYYISESRQKRNLEWKRYIDKTPPEIRKQISKEKYEKYLSTLTEERKEIDRKKDRIYLKNYRLKKFSDPEYKTKYYKDWYSKYIEKLTPEKKEDLRRYKREWWKNLTPEQREKHKERCRINSKRWRDNLPPEKKSILNENNKKYKAERWKTPEEKSAEYRRQYEQKLKKKLEYEHNCNLFKIEVSKAFPKVKNFLIKQYGVSDGKWNFDDLLQETYIVAWENRHKYLNGKGNNISAWLIKIAINLYLLNKKKTIRSKETLIPDYYDDVFIDMVDILDFSDLIDDRVDEIDRTAIIMDCYKNLPENQKIYLQLYLEGKTHREIAEQLGTTENYSKTRLYLIRNLLASEIEKNIQINISTSNGRKITG